MAAIDLTAGPDISDVARKLKELREAAQMTVSGVAGDVTAAKVLLDTLAKHVQQAQSEIGTDQAWVQQLRTQAGEVQEALSMAPAHLSTNALQGEIDRINAALTEELGLLEQNQQKLQGYNEQLAHSQRVLSGSQSGLQAWKQTLNEPAGNLLQKVAGGLTVCQGALKLVAADSEKLVKIQARLQAVREVVQGLSELSDSVYTTLSARLTVLAKVTDLWHAANLRVGKSLVSMGVAAHTALQQRAQAVAALDLASEKYKQAIQKMVEAENISNVADMKKTTKWNGKSQEVWSVSGFTDEQNKELNKRVQKARDHEETKIEKEGGANLSERQRRIYAAENNAAGTYIREIKKSLADAQMELETEAGKIISFGINKNAAADKVLQTAGISTPAETQVAENARRDAEQCARAEADVQQQLTQQLQEIHKQSVDATISEEDRRIAEIKTRYAKLREEVDKMLAAGSIDSSQSKTLNAQIDVAEQQEILNQLLDGIKTYEQQRSEIQEKYQEKRKSLYKDDGETLKEGVTQGNVEETNYQEEEALAALDETFAQREASYQAWMEQIATWSLDTLKQTLERAEQELQTLEESGTGNSKQLSSARAKVRTLKKQVEKEDSKTAGDSAASDNGVENWQKLGKTLTSVGSSFHEIGEAIGGTAGEVLSLAGTIASTTASIIDGIETLVNGTVEGVKTTTTTASASIQAMETASVILAIISAALKIAMAIAKFIQRESAATKHYEELKAKYETLVDVWDDLIERKQRYIDTSWGKELTAVNDQTQALIQQKIESQRALAVARVAAGASSGSHSYGYRMWQGSYKANGQNWRDVAGDINKELGVNIQGMSDFASLSAEQLLWIKEHYAELWASMDGDYKNALEHIIEYEDEAKEAIKAYKEQLTQVSFDDLYSNFVDTLMDMDASSENFADNLSEMLMRAVLSSMMGQKYSQKLEQWYDQFSQYMDEGGSMLTDQQINALKDDYMGYVDAAIAERDQIASIIGYARESADAQSASERGFQAMSQETGDELNGRFTAIQSDVHDIKAFILQLTDNGTMLFNETINIRDIMIQLNGHVADIRSYTRVLPAMHDTLASMNRKLDNL